MHLSETDICALRDEVPEPGRMVCFTNGTSVPSRLELSGKVGRVDHVRLYPVFVGVLVEIEHEGRKVLVEADPSELAEVDESSTRQDYSDSSGTGGA